MANWHVAGVTQGTKGNIIYHSIMFALYSILLVLFSIFFVYVIIDDGFKFEMIFGVFIIFGLRCMHKYNVHDCTSAYIKTAEYRFASQKSTTIDRLIIRLVNHYNKKWIPASFMCCSFSLLNPEEAYRSFSLSQRTTFEKTWKRSDTCCLYQCNKCHKYVFSIENAKSNQYAYIPIRNPQEAEDYSERWSMYSIQTDRPILHGYDDFWTWEHKDYPYNED